MFDREKFGARLREVRRAKGETQQELAELLSVTKTQVSDMENGKTATTMEKLVLICEHYGVSSDWLMGIER